MSDLLDKMVGWRDAIPDDRRSNGAEIVSQDKPLDLKQRERLEGMRDRLLEEAREKERDAARINAILGSARHFFRERGEKGRIG